MNQEKIEAFADDSITDEGIVCAAAPFDPTRLEEARSVLAQIKAKAPVPPETPLHCRVLFSGDARRGTAWESFPPQEIYSMLENLCEAMRSVQLQPVVAMIDRALVQPQFPAPGLPARMPSEKESASWAYMAVSNYLVTENRGKALKMWIDPDSTRIPWGTGRSRADRTRTSFWISLGEGKDPLSVQAQVADLPKPPLLEVADVYAYVTVQAHSGRGGQRVQRFQRLFNIIKPVTLRFYFPDRPQQWQDG